MGGRRVGLSHSGTRLLLPGASDNLIVNPGFEAGLTGWRQIGTGGAITSSTSLINAPHSGTAWYQSTENEGGVSQTVTVCPGSRYRLAFWHAVGQANSFRTATAKITAGDSTIATCETPNRPDTTWHEATIDFTAPPDRTSVTITITENSWLRLDDVSLVEII
nr:carbohydrate binding domain-containing protein [Bifidobacterium sp. DSM 109960]